MTAPRPRPDPASAPRPRRLLTLEEYYAFEEDNPVRHEYVRGEVFAMSPGVRRAHGIIGTNIAWKLRGAAGGGPCRVYQSEVKVQVDDVVYYPDVMVACGPEPDNPYIEDAPCFLAEVLSRSTRTTDLRDKAPNYRRLASLQLLLIVEQSVRRVSRYWRDETGAWQLEDVIGQGAIPVPCPVPADGPLVLTLDDIYAGVTFPPKRVREVSPEWLAEDPPAWMFDPVDLPSTDEPGAEAPVGAGTRHED